ncbi:hypothetical protein Q5P01_014835 [Channa striata]|uniref:Protein CUSTOS n=1 Tax=Channa striata TaxID=64152 RepID=A0AA88SLE2_CHASR|nr:hypothetical protein Q5P01_014835 [Channa striata]
MDQRSIPQSFIELGFWDLEECSDYVTHNSQLKNTGSTCSVMACTAKKMVGFSDSSSSGDDEVLKRCQEAVWETRINNKKDENSDVKKSKRVVVAEHEHDGNELQVTQGFRTHVAKKLGNLLDSYITETQSETPTCMESVKCDDDDEGFRLFSTSVPGQTAEDPPAPVRRRPVSSSSDSDSEMESRLREAAVSVGDLLPSSTQPPALTTPSKDSPCSEKIKKKKTAAEERERNVKKKKKRKQNLEEGKHVDSAGSPLNNQSNSEQGSSELEHTQVKIKAKKKKGNAAKEALN